MGLLAVRSAMAHHVGVGQGYTPLTAASPIVLEREALVSLAAAARAAATRVTIVAVCCYAVLTLSGYGVLTMATVAHVAAPQCAWRNAAIAYLPRVLVARPTGCRLGSVQLLAEHTVSIKGVLTQPPEGCT